MLVTEDLIARLSRVSYLSNHREAYMNKIHLLPTNFPPLPKSSDEVGNKLRLHRARKVYDNVDWQLQNEHPLALLSVRHLDHTDAL